MGLLMWNLSPIPALTGLASIDQSRNGFLRQAQHCLHMTRDERIMLRCSISALVSVLDNHFREDSV